MRKKQLDALEKKLWKNARASRAESKPDLPGDFNSSVLRKIRVMDSKTNETVLHDLTFKGAIVSLLSAACILLIMTAQTAFPTSDAITGMLAQVTAASIGIF
jgi:hypothetical protein